MSARLKRATSNDPSRFEGNGISYKAKLIGIEDVKEARGDLMCQEALIKLKNSVKISGEHKRKIFVNVTLEGLKIIDAISLPAENQSKLLSAASLRHITHHASNQNKKKTESKSSKLGGEGNEQNEQGHNLIVLHAHPVHRISFISRDTTDNRAFGYVFGTEDGLHKFFAIKTAAAAEHLVLTLRDLFQVVYEMKKKEMEAAKEKLEKGELTTNVVKENSQTSGAGSTSGNGQTPAVQKANADTENIYQVPRNNAPVVPATQAEQVANLLDLEDQAEHILKGIEQIKNLEFDSVTSDTFSSPTSPQTSPLTKLTPSSSAVNASDDIWGFSTPATFNSPATSSSGLGDLAGLQTGTFPAMGQQSFSPTNFSMQSGFGVPTGFNMMSGSLPLAKDPFGNDPFGSTVQQSRVPVASGYGVGPGFNQLYGMQSMPPQLGMMGVVIPGMVPRGMMSPPVMAGMRSPFGVQQPTGFQNSSPFGEDLSILQPMKKDAGFDSNAIFSEPVKTATKTREDLFGDLLEIKKSSPATARSPKDMFAQINAPERKPMNEMIAPAWPSKSSPLAQSQNKPPQASDAVSDPFGDTDSVILDKTRGLLLSDSGEEDPFDTSHIPHVLAESINQPIHLVKSLNACTTPPPVPLRQPSSKSSHTYTTSSPMPSSLPPPLPTSLPQPVSCITIDKLEYMKDMNENISSSFSDIMLPPPTDPPPLLPAHLVIEAPSLAPPSPSTPRPKVKCAQQFPHNQHKGHDGSTQEPETISKLPNSNDITSSPAHNFNPTFKDSCKSEISETINNDTKSCDTAECDSPDSKNSNSENYKHHNSYHYNDDNSFHVCASKLHNLDWVGFDNSENLPENQSDLFLPSQPLSINDDDGDDPFDMPLHLTHGFKAVAKFGSDPFDDSHNDAWQPFATPDHGFNQVNHDSPMNSPFGDAFVTPTQQAASKSLFD